MSQIPSLRARARRLGAIAAAVAILWLSIGAVPCPAQQAPESTPRAEEKIRIERLAALCRLWGKVKFFHPFPAYRDIDWDQALLETLPKVEAATSAEEYRAAVDHMLAQLDDPTTRTRDGVEAERSESPEPAFPSVRHLDDKLVLVDATDYPALGATQRYRGGLFTAAFEESAEAEGMILDLRGKAGSESWQAYVITMSLRRDLGVLLAGEIALPAPRRRMHSGYAGRRPGSGGYFSGFLYEDRPLLRGQRDEPLPLVVLINAASEGMWSVLGGLRAAAATIIHHGKPSGVVPEATSVAVPLTDGVVAEVRSEELVHVDGTTHFLPDFVVEATAGGENGAADAAVETALAILRGEQLPAAARPLEPRQAPVSPVGRQRYESPDPEISELSREHRLLALFRYWNVIEYFFPYKELMDHPWDEVLTRFIPRLAAADDPQAYVLALAELVAQTQDSHSRLASEHFREFVGTHSPALLAEFVEDQLVVTFVPSDPVAPADLAVGDVILAVDGQSIAEHRRRLEPYLAASTPQALRLRLSRAILAGAEGSDAQLTVRTGDGEPRHVVTARNSLSWKLYQQMTESRELPVYGLLPEGLGYVDLNRLEPGDVEAAFEALREAPGIIFDLRGYPRGTAWAITPWLSAEPAAAARFRRPMYFTAHTAGADGWHFQQRFPAGSAPWQYQGRIVVLINEKAISQAEHTALFFESAYGDVTFIGSPTNGANGDVTGLDLPGGIWVMFTGHDVRHADGRPLQRVGIRPDIAVAPTIAGIRAGRDEVLERAVDYLSGNGDY